MDRRRSEHAWHWLALHQRRQTPLYLPPEIDDSVEGEELEDESVAEGYTGDGDIGDEPDDDDDDADSDKTCSDDHSDDDREAKRHPNDRSHSPPERHRSRSSSSCRNKISDRRRRCHRGRRTAAVVFAMLCFSTIVFVLIHHRHLTRRRRPTNGGRSLDDQPINVNEGAGDDGNINRELETASDLLENRSSWSLRSIGDIWRKRLASAVKSRRRDSRRTTAMKKSSTKTMIDRTNLSQTQLDGVLFEATIGLPSGAFQTYKLTHPYPGVIAVRVVESNLSERLRQFNVALEQLRVDLFTELSADDIRRDRRSSSFWNSPKDGARVDITARTAASGSSQNVSEPVRRFLRQWNNDQLLIVDGGNGGGVDGIGDQLATAEQNAINVVIANEDDYLKRLSAEFPLVRILTLPWLRTSSTGDKAVRWDSRTDFANLFVQNYYAWTTGKPLCRWICQSFPTPELRYGLLFQPECLTLRHGRDRHSTATITVAGTRCRPNYAAVSKPSLTVDDLLDRSKSLSPLHLWAKTVSRSHYWPNRGRRYPARFYAEPPPFVVQLHVMHDALVTWRGDVIGAGRLRPRAGERIGQSDARSSRQFENVKLARYFCKEKEETSIEQVPVSSPVYDEVFTVGMIGARNYYHRLVEQIARLAPYVEFLARNPSIRIHVLIAESEKETDSDGKDGGGGLAMTIALIEALGIPRAGDRVVSGSVRATIAYVPRFAECLWSRPVELQTMATLYRRHIQTALFDGEARIDAKDAQRVDSSNTRNQSVEDIVRHPDQSPQPMTTITRKTRIKDRVIMIRRSNERRLVRGNLIEKIVERAAVHHGLRFTLFDDRSLPSIDTTMRWFSEAVMVVAPHGAGLANIVFCDPGTYVVEIVCQWPLTRLCFLHTAHVLGHRYHAVPATSGCPHVLQTSVDAVDQAVRMLLDHWSASTSGTKRNR